MPGNDGPLVHLQRRVMHVALNPGLGLQLQHLARMNRALDAAVDDDVVRHDFARYFGGLGNNQNACLIIARTYVSTNFTINAQAIGSGASVYIAWNIPGSTTPTQLAGMKTWMRSVVASIGTGDTRLFIKRFGLETEGAAGASPYLDSSNMAFVLDWIDSQVVETDPGSSSDWNIAFSDATSFFAAGYDGGAGANFSTGALADGLGSLFTGVSTEVRTDSVRNIVIALGVKDPVGTSIAATSFGGCHTLSSSK